MRLIIPALIVATMVSFASAGALSGYTKVPLSSIQTITLYPNQHTKARRTSPIPQLTCVGSACRQYERYVEVVQCSNMGDDGSGDIQWRCQTDLPSPLKLGRVDVSCEGWSGPDDSEVLQGSCGLTYRLVKPSGDIDKDPEGSHNARLDSILQFVFNVLFFSILAFILYSFYTSCMRDRRASSDRQGGPGGGHYSGFNGGGGHGGGGEGGNDPPPPYDPTAKPTSGDNAAPPPSTSRSGLGGFWTGLGVGGAGALGASYLANQRRERERYYREQDPVYGGIGRSDRWDSDRDEGTSRWDWDRQPRHHFGRPNGSGGSSSLGEVRTTSGFGGSSVR